MTDLTSTCLQRQRLLLCDNCITTAAATTQRASPTRHRAGSKVMAENKWSELTPDCPKEKLVKKTTIPRAASCFLKTATPVAGRLDLVGRNLLLSYRRYKDVVITVRLTVLIIKSRMKNDKNENLAHHQMTCKSATYNISKTRSNVTNKGVAKTARVLQLPRDSAFRHKFVDFPCAVELSHKNFCAYDLIKVILSTFRYIICVGTVENVETAKVERNDPAFFPSAGVC
jgi:hypothetical protein